MQFTNLLFLYGFLPLAFLLYLPLSKSPLKNLYLFVISLVFYAWGSLQSLVVLLFVLVWNWICSLQLGREQSDAYRKIQLYSCVGVNLLVLMMYKYMNPWLMSINSIFGTSLQPIRWIVPAGLSFYMFSCLSCIFDVYRRKAKPLASPIDFGVFAAFFGWVNMGPIAHYNKMLPQLKHHPVTREKINAGALMFVQGLMMKVVLADNFAVVFSALEGNSSWLGNLLLGFSYFFQLFFDFAGYSRMARGIASLFGFEVPKNFDLPYTATSVSEFWRRWHISLTSWFRDYVYIPMGGNRVSETRWILNVLTVWLLTGFWHGATFHFILWGLYQGALQLMERLVFKDSLKTAPKWVLHTYVVLSQLIGWTFFFPSTTGACFQIIGRYFFIGISALFDSEALFVFKESFFLLIAGAVCSTSLPALLGQGMSRSMGRSYPALQTVMYILALALCTALLISATNQTFLYAAF